jgi:methylenetetrahydrofolate dehydrogenase (NADP+)/methenyltetrahydrofolate cyclohydrolase
MPATVLDGKALAARIRGELKVETEKLAAEGITPGLAVVLVGDDPASQIYVRNKTTACAQVGIKTFDHRLPASTTTDELLRLVATLNADAQVDGILIQLPLPRGIDARRVLFSVDPGKDVDGIHPENVGRLLMGEPRFIACTPFGVMKLIEEARLPLAGAQAVVVGRSNMVGKPMAALLLAADATVTVCHSKTRDLPALCREADVLVAAIGRPGFVTREFVREGAAVVDVGINRVNSLEEAPEGLRRSERLRRILAEKGKALVGDVDFDDVAPKAGYLTPVPGGVGPLTVAMLLSNTIKAAGLFG